MATTDETTGKTADEALAGTIELFAALGAIVRGALMVGVIAMGVPTAADEDANGIGGGGVSTTLALGTTGVLPVGTPGLAAVAAVAGAVGAAGANVGVLRTGKLKVGVAACALPSAMHNSTAAQPSTRWRKLSSV